MNRLLFRGNCKTPIGRFLALLPIFAIQRKSPTLKSMWICIESQKLAKSSKNRQNRKFCNCLFTALSLVFLSSCCRNVPPMTAVRDVHSATEISEIYERASQVSLGALSLDDILTIALQQNLDVQVKAYEYEIQREAITGERVKMLPNLFYHWEWDFRNKNTGISSQSLVPGIPPAPPSISSTRTRLLDSVQVIWNLLDFGLSYYRSKQEEDKAVIACLEHERLRQNLVLDVTKSYWKAAASKRIVEKGKVLVSQANAQIEEYEKQMAEGALSEIAGLSSIIDALRLGLDIQQYEKDYHDSMASLYLLMALPPNCDFELQDPSLEELPYLEHLDLNEMIKIALMNRPELYEGDLKEEIYVEETRLALLRMLPNLEISGGFFEDHNKFLIFHNWFQNGIRILGNLMCIPQQLSAYKSAEMNRSLAKHNRLALAMGIMTQLYLCYYSYLDGKEMYQLSVQLHQANERLLEAAIKENQNGKMQKAELLRISSQELFSEMETIKAYAEVQVAIEQFNNTLGLPRYFFQQESDAD